MPQGILAPRLFGTHFWNADPQVGNLRVMPYTVLHARIASDQEGWEEEEEAREQKKWQCVQGFFAPHPTNNALLTDLLLSSDAEILHSKH